MTSDQIKSFITKKMCCVQQKGNTGYLNVTKGGKDMFCDAALSFSANAMLHVLRCVALEEVCKPTSADCNDPVADIEGAWVCTEVCVADTCTSVYSATEFAALVDSIWTFTANETTTQGAYNGDVTIENVLGSGTFSWLIATNQSVTSDFSFEPPAPYVGKINISSIDCDNMIITFEQSGLDPVTITLARSSYLNEETTTCEFICLSESEICDIINWLKRYCNDCNDYLPKTPTS